MLKLIQDISKNDVKELNLTDTLVLSKSTMNDNLIFITFSITEANNKNSELYIAHHERYIKKYDKKCIKCVISYDVSHLQNIDMSLIQSLIKNHEEYEEEYDRVVICVVVHTANELITHTAKVCVNLKGPKIPVLVSSDLEYLHTHLGEIIQKM
jgi:hypothetical protein